MHKGIHAAQPLVPSPSRIGFQTAIGKLKNYKSPGSDLVQARGERLLSVNHKFINTISNKEELLVQWEKPVIVHNLKSGKS
jgi:hypothetical protein